MKTHTTDIQILNDKTGKPAFVVIPYEDYIRIAGRNPDDYLPQEVVDLMQDNGWTLAKSWREHLHLTQEVVASRMGVTQSAYAQLEASKNLRMSSREKIARALGISAQSLPLDE